MRIVAAALAGLLLAAPAAAQSSEEVHAAERTRFGFGELRPGASGDPAAANPANTDEAAAGTLAPPPLFTRESQRSPSGWHRYLHRRKGRLQGHRPEGFPAHQSQP